MQQPFLRFLTVCLVILFVHRSASAQNAPGALIGIVTTSDHMSAGGVVVSIKGTGKNTITGEKGVFVFKSVKPGTYTLVASLVSHETVQQQVTITDSNTTEVHIQLATSAKDLEEVVIISSASKYANKKTEYVSKLPLNNLENPQVYTALPKELFMEQIITDFGNILKNSPGIYKIQGNRGINSDGASVFTLRGFRTEAAFTDGVPSQANGELDPANVESVEVMKGPSGTLYGGAITSFGGLINIVTKKPLDTIGGNVSYTGGSFNLNRFTADIYGPINKEKTVLARVNAAYQSQSHFQDAGFKKSFLVAPSIEYRPNAKTSIRLNAGFYSGESTSPPVIFLNRTRKFVALTPDDLHFDWNRSYTSNDLTMKTPTVNIRGQINYQLSDQWSSRTTFSSNTRKSDGFYMYEFIRGPISDTLLERNLSLQNTTNTAKDIQQNFTGDFKIGGLRNRLVFGLDYVNQTINNNNSPYIIIDSLSGISNDKKYTNLNRPAVEAKLAASKAAPTKNNSSSNIYSAYASNVLNITDQLLAMLSLRIDHFQSKGTVDQTTNALVVNSKYEQTALSPKFGLVYFLVKNQVSLFGNYMNGFSKTDPVTQPLPEYNGNFKPQQANQWEAGVKLNILKNRLSFTASYYDIKVENITRVEVIQKNNVNYNVTFQSGTQYSKGFELELIANPLNGLNLFAGYSHNTSKLTKSTAVLEGRRPAGAGPADLGNLWASYTIPSGKFKGMGAGFGGNYIGKHLTANSVTTGVFTLPSYSVLNATAFYDTKWYRIGLKFDNLTDQRYFIGQGVLSPQPPINFAANLTIKF